MIAQGDITEPTMTAPAARGAGVRGFELLLAKLLLSRP